MAKLTDLPENFGFIGCKEEPSPRAFIQWKGTEVCMDFYCECGAHLHFDGFFAYAMRCPHCHVAWEMPCMIYPRKVAAGYTGIIQDMEPDQDRDDGVVDATFIEISGQIECGK